MAESQLLSEEAINKTVFRSRSESIFVIVFDNMKSFLSVVSILVHFTCSAQAQQKAKETAPSLADKKQASAINAVTAILLYAPMTYAEQQERFDGWPQFGKYLEYVSESDSVGVVFVKNRLNHTTHKMRISFDSLLPSRILQYSTVRIDEHTDSSYRKWIPELRYSFRPEYNQDGRLDRISSAFKGEENVPHNLREFRFYYRGPAIDSIVDTDNLQRKRSVGYFNGHARPDSIHLYGYTIPDGVVYFDRKEIYISRNVTERSKLSPQGPNGFELTHIQNDSAGRITTFEKQTRNASTQKVHQAIWVFGYSSGSVRTGKKYTSNSDKAVDFSSITRSTPHISTYTANAKGQVIQEFITYTDDCLDTEQIISFNLDADGFLRQSRSVSKSRKKCND